jgi:hypothetical protein
MDVHELCLKEIAAGIKGLQTCFRAEEIRVQRLDHKVESDGSVTIHTWERGVTVFPLQEQESAGTNLREDIGYGCGVLFVFPNDHGPKDNVGKVLEARALTRRRFIHQRMTTVALSGGMYLTTKVAHLPINQPRGPHTFEVSSLVIRCWMREPRG